MVALVNFAGERHRMIGTGTTPAEARAVLARLTGGGASYAEMLDGGARGFLLGLSWRVCAPRDCHCGREAVLLLADQADAVMARWPGLDAWVQVSAPGGKLSPIMMAFVPEASHLASALWEIEESMAASGSGTAPLAA